MRFDKKVLNSLSKRYAVMAIGAASVLGACSKDNGPGVEQHDTTYTFAPFQYEQLDDLEQIRRSADSIEVRHIYFEVQSGDEYGWEGINLNGTIKHVDAAFDAARGKGRGKGVFENVTDDPALDAPIKKLRKYNYGIEFMAAPQNQR